MRFINITQYDVRFRINTDNLSPEPDPQDIIFSPSGCVARVSSAQEITQVIPLDGEGERTVPFVKTVFGEPENLPEPEEGVIFIASTPMAQKAVQMGRTDVVSPNTAPGKDVRLDGRTYAVFSFQEF